MPSWRVGFLAVPILADLGCLGVRVLDCAEWEVDGVLEAVLEVGLKWVWF